MAKKIFIFSFVIACLIQGFIFTKLGMADFTVWSSQAKYFESGNPQMFNTDLAYGHPGGPIIEGVILIHGVSKISYENSLIIFMIVLGGLAAAGASVLSYKLSGNNLWWPIVLITLSCNWLYISSTPPSTIVSLLIAFLCLFSLYIYKKSKIKPYLLVFWSILVGFIIATRADIGAIMAISFLIFIKPKLCWRQTFGIALGISASFILFDPFMWFMPIQHIQDLVFKMVYHYEYFNTPSKMSFSYLLGISAFSFLSMLLSAIFLFFKERMGSPVPPRLVYVLLAATGLLYTVFLTSVFQASRYFLPLISVWTIFLPLFIFSLTTKLPIFSFSLF
jgi:hypothetical protein